MKIKRVYFILLLGTMMLSLCACSRFMRKDPSWLNVKKSGELSIGIDHAFAPLSYEENGELVGFDIDLAKAVGKQLGIEVRFRPLVWKEAETKLLEKKVDVLWSGCTITDKRKEDFSFSNPYLYNSQKYFFKTGLNLERPADLKNRVVGVHEGRTKELFQKQVEVIASVKELKSYRSPKEVMLACIGEKVEVAVVEELSGRAQLNQMKVSLDALPQGFNQVAYGVMVRQEDKTLLQAIDAALDQLRKQGVSKEISKKWFGQNLIPDSISP